MTSLAAELRAVQRRALRLRGSVRAMAAKLQAAEYALLRDLQRNDDPRLRSLAEALAAERRAVMDLGNQLDERLARTGDACRALDAAAGGRMAGRRTFRVRAV